MKKLFSILFVFLVSHSAYGQGSQSQGAPTQLNSWKGAIRGDSAFYLPSNLAKYPWFDSCGRMWFNKKGDSGIYFNDCLNRVKLLSTKDTNFIKSIISGTVPNIDSMIYATRYWVDQNFPLKNTISNAGYSGNYNDLNNKLSAGNGISISGSNTINNIGVISLNGSSGSILFTTLAQYGITNAYTQTQLQTSGQSAVHFGNMTNKPTTLSGYGITDGVTTTQNALNVKYADTLSTIATKANLIDSLKTKINSSTLFYPELVKSIFKGGIYTGSPNSSQISTTTARSRINLIAATANQTFVIQGLNSPINAVQFIKFFDVTGIYVSQASSSTVTTPITGGLLLTIPNNISIAQFGLNMENADTATVSIKAGISVNQVNTIRQSVLPDVDFVNNIRTTIHMSNKNYNVDVSNGLGYIISATGAFVQVAGYNSSMFINTYNATNIDLYGNFNTATRVAFYDKSKTFISSTLSSGVSSVLNSNVPPTARYFRFSVLSTTPTDRVNFRVNTTDSSFLYVVESGSVSTTSYVSLSGNDVSGSGTQSNPFRTINKALTVRAGGGEVILLSGDYIDEPINYALASGVKLSGIRNGTVRILYGNRVTSATLEPGYTKVYKASIPFVVNSYDYWLWQHDINDTSTQIPITQRHPLQKDRVFRMGSRILKKATSIQQIEDSSGLWHYYSGGNLYFSKVPGSDLSVNPIVMPIFTPPFVDAKSLNFENIQFLYAPFLFRGATGTFNNVACKYTNYTAFFSRDTATMVYNNCEAAGSYEDGFGYNNYAIGKEVDVWTHDNGDEGSSIHDHVNITRIGGLYEHNVSAVTDVGTSHTYMENSLCRYNTGTPRSPIPNDPMLFSYYAVDGIDNGNATIINCITDGSINCGVQPGAQLQNRVRAYNCFSNNVMGYVESIPSTTVFTGSDSKKYRSISIGGATYYIPLFTSLP